MPVLEQRLQQPFFDSADLLYQAAESLARPLADALQALVGSITGGGKLIIAGGALAPHAALLFVHGFERERPPLAALALAADPQPLRALGLPGDVLLLVDNGEGESAPVIAAARGKDMTLVLLAGRGAPELRELLAESDVLVAVPHERGARVAEVHMLVLHCLCDAIDFQLMGDLEP